MITRLQRHTLEERTDPMILIINLLVLLMNLLMLYYSFVDFLIRILKMEDSYIIVNSML